MLHDDPPARRWPRAQRFSLSGRGRILAAAYRKGIVEAGSQRDHSAPRDHGAFAAACASWAAQFELHPDDGMYLSEIAERPLTLSQLGEALAICSQSHEDIKRCLSRLLGVGLVVAGT